MKNPVSPSTAAKPLAKPPVSKGLKEKGTGEAVGKANSKNVGPDASQSVSATKKKKRKHSKKAKPSSEPQTARLTSDFGVQFPIKKDAITPPSVRLDSHTLGSASLVVTGETTSQDLGGRS